MIYFLFFELLKFSYIMNLSYYPNNNDLRIDKVHILGLHNILMYYLI
jgi:hypothetical protein